MFDEDFRAKVQDLIDKNEIRELTSRGLQAFDDGDADGYANTYLIDGGHTPTFEGGWPNERGQQRGRDQHIAQVKRIDTRVVHMTTDHIIEIDGDTARQVCTFIIFTRDKERTTNRFAMTGRYVDALRRTPDGWRFAERQTVWDLHKPFTEILGIEDLSPPRSEGVVGDA